MEYSDRKLIVAIVAQELADIDPRGLDVYEYTTYTLPNAVRKLAYWLEQPVSALDLDDAQEALTSLARLRWVATADELWDEFAEGTRYLETVEDAIDRLRDSFDDAYESAVINMIGVEPRG